MRKAVLRIIIASIVFSATTSLAFATEVVHKIKQGDNLWTIAKKYQVSVNQIKTLNGFSGTPRLKIGQTVIIKKERTSTRLNTKKSLKIAKTQPLPVEEVIENEDFIEHRAKRGDTIDKLAQQFGVEKEEIVEANNFKGGKIKPGTVVLIPKPLENQDDDDLVTLPSIPVRTWKNKEEPYMLVKVAKSFVGAPYKFGGNTVRGLDCSAYVKKIYEIFDVQLPRSARDQYKVGPKIAKEGLSVGDLVFFKTRRYAKYPTHVGIYIGEGKFIHSSSSQGRIGVKIDSLASDYYSRTYIGATRIKKQQAEDNSEKTISTESNLSNNT